MSYLVSRKRWVLASRPTRSDAEVRKLWDICSGGDSGKPCPLFTLFSRRHKLGKCRKCGCALNLGQRLNKLYWATESCPDKPPRWPAKIIERRGEWIENPDWTERMVDPETKLTEKQRRREERRIRREEKRKAREERIRKRKEKHDSLGRHQDLMVVPVNEDPLQIYDRNVTALPVSPIRNLWWPSPGAFLVCGGPSVNELPYKRLADQRVMSIGVNNVAGWVPTKAMVYSDPTEKFHGAIFMNPGVMKFVPVPKLKNQIRLRDPVTREFIWGKLRVRDCPNVWGFQRRSVFNPDSFLHDEQAHWGGEFSGNKKILYTPYLAYRLLIHLGIKNIFLLGVDHVMDDRGYAFPQGRHTGAIKSNNRHYQITNEALCLLRPKFEEAGIHVYNCNKDSHCPAFDYFPFEDAFDICTAHVPPHPLDLEDWYEKDGGKDREDDD